MAITSMSSLQAALPQSFDVGGTGNTSFTDGPRQVWTSATNGVLFPRTFSASNPQTSANGIPFKNPVGSDFTYLSAADFATNIYQSNPRSWLMIVDVLWQRQGLSGTTNATSLNTGRFLPRDINGTDDGVGVYALLFQGGTNAANALGNCILVYTNSAGTIGQVSTLTYPASVQAGPVFFFRLASGDVGIQAVNSIQFTTTGSNLSLAVFRPIALLFLGSDRRGNMNEDALTLALPRVHNDSCIQMIYGGGAAYTGQITLSQG